MSDLPSAGRELDRQVAQQVMGWRRHGMFWLGANNQTASHYHKFCPSVSIAHAFTVVEKMRADGWWFGLSQDSTDIWDAHFWPMQPNLEGLHPHYWGHDDYNNLPGLAIVRAALKAVEAATP